MFLPRQRNDSAPSSSIVGGGPGAVSVLLLAEEGRAVSLVTGPVDLAAVLFDSFSPAAVAVAHRAGSSR